MSKKHPIIKCDTCMFNGDESRKIQCRICKNCNYSMYLEKDAILFQEEEKSIDKTMQREGPSS